MNKSYFWPALAGIVVLLIAILGAVDLSTNEGSSSASGATASPSKTAAPKASQTPSQSPISSASPDSGQRLLFFRFGCKNPGSEPEYFFHVDHAWEAGPFEYCEALTVDDDGKAETREPEAFQLEALKIAYETDHSREKVNRLYGICAQTAGVPIDVVVGAAQTAEIEGALMLCPKHPKAATIQANIAAGKEFRDAQAEIDKATEEGRLAGEGSYLVGPDVQPGTWQSVGDRVENCYWEVSDAQGNIMANNYIRIAPQFTIDVPANASGFTVRGCSFKLISP